MPAIGRRLARSFFERDVLEVAPDVIGRVIATGTGSDAVAIRLTEVEAYAGPVDPASHAFRRTARSEIMWGEAGHLYVYFVYGMHWCANIVTGPPGAASAILLRAGDVIAGIDIAEGRRPAVRKPEHLARGPAAVATVLGMTGPDTGADLCAAGGRWQVRAGDGSPPVVHNGPRAGVSSAAENPWRFFEAGAPSVSAYRRGTRATRGRAQPH